MDLNTLIYFSFKFTEIFKKLTLVNISVCPWCPKVSAHDIFVSFPLENFKTIFNICVLGIQTIYLNYYLAWKALEYIKWFR